MAEKGLTKVGAATPSIKTVSIATLSITTRNYVI
jgi:hypothetical protein